MKLLCVLLILFLAGCGDRYSLDEKRGPDPKGFVTTHPLSLPPDYLLRAPEPAVNEKTPAKDDKETTEKKEPEKEEVKTEETKTEEGTKSAETDKSAKDVPQQETSKEETEN